MSWIFSINEEVFSLQSLLMKTSFFRSAKLSGK